MPNNDLQFNKLSKWLAFSFLSSEISSAKDFFNASFTAVSFDLCSSRLRSLRSHVSSLTSSSDLWLMRLLSWDSSEAALAETWKSQKIDYS